MVTKTYTNDNIDNGLNVLLLSGVHGNEMTSIYTLSRIIDNLGDIDISNIKNLNIVNAINIEAIKLCQRGVSNNYTNDLNRINNITSYSDLQNQIKKFIDINDIIIDVHSSPNICEMVLIDIDKHVNCLNDFCIDYDINSCYRYNSNNTIKSYSLNNNKISFTVELCGMDSINYKSSVIGLNIINKIISNIHNLTLSIEKPSVNIKEMREIKTYISGIFIPDVYLGQNIIKGQIIGKIIDLDLSIIDTIYSKYDCKIISLENDKFINVGSTIGLIQPL